MSVISKEAFGYSDQEWADLIRAELDAGRPVLYMATEPGGAGHAFVIDGYRDDGLVHVNFGWGGYGNGYYDANVLAGLQTLSDRGRVLERTTYSVR